MIENPRRYLAILFLVSAAFFLLDRSGALSGLYGAARTHIGVPVFGHTHRGFITVSRFFSSIFSIRKIVKEYHALSLDRDHFRGEYLRLRAVESENEFLRQALQLEERKPGNLVLAGVVGFDPLGAQEILVINKGSQDGISPGQGVISHGRTFVGYVLDVEGESGRVQLITSEKSRVAALLQGSGTHVTLTGTPTGALSLELIPKDVPILEGELVLTSGLGGALPPHLLIGEVRRVIDEETASFKRAVVRPFVDAQHTGQVFVITEF